MRRVKQAVLRIAPEAAIPALARTWQQMQALWPWKPVPKLEVGRFDGFEVAYRQGTTDSEVLAHSFDHDIFFPGIPEYHCAPDHTIIDVGAHIGTFSLLASSKVPRGKVFAVEACRESANFCRINAALNRLNNLDVSHLALSDRQGEVVLHYDRGNWGHSIVAPMSGGGEKVASDTLANFMTNKGIARCHLLRMNCEGAEFPILLSAPPEILRRIDNMLILFHCDLYQGASEQRLLSHLQSSGFATTVRQRQPSRGWIIATRASA